jgi:hypothetical protein
MLPWPRRYDPAATSAFQRLYLYFISSDIREWSRDRVTAQYETVPRHFFLPDHEGKSHTRSYNPCLTNALWMTGEQMLTMATSGFSIRYAVFQKIPCQLHESVRMYSVTIQIQTLCLPILYYLLHLWNSIATLDGVAFPFFVLKVTFRL